MHKEEKEPSFIYTIKYGCYHGHESVL